MSKLQDSDYKVIIDITEIQKATAKFDITLEQFMSMWYELEPYMIIVEKTNNLNKEEYEC